MPTIAQASDQIRNRRLSPLELTRACLDAIERRSPELNAFITINAESAITEARRAEAEIAQGNWRGPLHGIPIALKDILDTAGTRTTAASNVFRDRIPSEDAEVVRRLKAWAGICSMCMRGHVPLAHGDLRLHGREVQLTVVLCDEVKSRPARRVEHPHAHRR